ncbi:hypothetical protein HOY82DRAFT_589827 [Tuber indicum]|nr:hypothetical protein HOY82DRAFT_589827 [Tuber indicum]
MFRLSRQTKILSPALIHRRIWFRGFHDEFIPDGTGNDGTGGDSTANDGTGNDSTRNGGTRNGGTRNGGTRNDGTRNDGYGSRSDIFDQSTFKVDVIKSIGELGNELRQSIDNGNVEVRRGFAEVRKEFAEVHKEFAGVHKEFANLKPDQKVMKWQLHLLFFGASSVKLVLWTLKDYIQLRFPAFFANKEGTPPHEQPEAPQKKLQK